MRKIRFRSSTHTAETQSTSANDQIRAFAIPSSCRPPPASVSQTLGRLIFCQVCGHLLEIPLNSSKLIVQCNFCHESTPSRPPPSDRRFFRCTCGLLLLVPVYVHSVECPRARCRRLLLLPATTVVELPERQSHSQIQITADDALSISSEATELRRNGRPIELRCGACYRRFFEPDALGLTSDVQCPFCKRLTSVGPDFARGRAISMCIYASILLVISLTVTITTYCLREKMVGLHSIQLGMSVGSLLMFLLALNYYNMPVSRIVIGGYEV
ncbi:unnamed protein product [Calicophoron daubneyi]|uniref:Phosphatidylinositol-4,5-bisphosphate 4-phosphatase n=1 Tax=Calicophoron daubneyi TaxID=300641 RepID=A0AAV2TUA6_CALDB